MLKLRVPCNDIISSTLNFEEKKMEWNKLKTKKNLEIDFLIDSVDMDIERKWYPMISGMYLQGELKFEIL